MATRYGGCAAPPSCVRMWAARRDELRCRTGELGVNCTRCKMCSLGHSAGARRGRSFCLSIAGKSENERSHLRKARPRGGIPQQAPIAQRARPRHGAAPPRPSPANTPYRCPTFTDRLDVLRHAQECSPPLPEHKTRGSSDDRGLGVYNGCQSRIQRMCGTPTHLSG